MLRIPCPHCGLRDESEFRYGGEATVTRPVEPGAVDDRAWSDYLYYRDNRRGPHGERWYHAWGCRQWFVLERNTLTHEWLPAEPPV